MSQRTNLRIIISLCILLVLGTLFFADLRAAMSDTRAEAQVSTTTSHPVATDSSNESKDLFVFVEDNPTLTQHLAQVLSTGGEPLAGVARVMPLTAPPNAEQRPALVVALDQNEFLWTPLYGRARLQIRFVYASDPADLSPRASEPMTLSIGEGEPTIRIQGEVNLIDQTRGFTTRPAYLGHLTQAAAQQIQIHLRQALGPAWAGEEGLAR